MKHFYLPIVVLIFLIIGCQNEMPDVKISNSESQTFPSDVKSRSAEDAVAIAMDAYAKMYPNSSASISSRGTPQPIVKVITSGEKSRSASNDSLLYIVNFPVDNGFAFIAAPENVEPVLGVAEFGSYGLEDSEINPGLDLFVELAQEYVLALGNGLDGCTDSPNGVTNDTCWQLPNPAIREYDYEDTIFRHKVQRRISNAWSYGNGKTILSSNPEGFLFAKRYCGDAVVSIAQVMLYFQYPHMLKPSYPKNSSNVAWFTDTLSPNYTNLQKHRKCYMRSEKPLSSEAESCKCSTETQTEISKICRAIANFGEATDPGNSDYPFPHFNKFQALNAVQKLGFSAPGFYNYNANIYLSSESDEILLMGGLSQKYGKVLYWLIDGELDYKINHYHCKDKGIISSEKTLLYTYSPQRVHINWGNAGNGNGWFTKGVYTLPPEAIIKSANDTMPTIVEGMQFLRIRKP